MVLIKDKKKQKRGVLHVFVSHLVFEVCRPGGLRVVGSGQVEDSRQESMSGWCLDDAVELKCLLNV